MDEMPRPDALEKLLTRADKICVANSADLPETLFKLFGAGSSKDNDLPLGAVSLLGSGGKPEEYCWALATPVHLVADRDSLRLHGPGQLQITHDEATRLVGLFNTHFKQAGLNLVNVDPEMWYLQLSNCPKITTTSVESVVGRDIAAFLPDGPDSKAWISILNEIQMLFFQSEVNQKRLAEGKAVISGLWLSGFGRLPEINSNIDSIYGSHPLVKGLSMIAKVSHTSSLENFHDITSTKGIVVNLHTGFLASKLAIDTREWEAVLHSVNEHLKRLIETILSDTNNALLIMDCEGSAYSTDKKKMQRRFWKKNKGLDSCYKRGGITRTHSV
ncbi:MAG: hypothetical protein ABW201_06455 [Candidatus Thiodiazotropha sp.]